MSEVVDIPDSTIEISKLKQDLFDERRNLKKLSAVIHDLNLSVEMLEKALEDVKKTARYKAHSAEKFALIERLSMIEAENLMLRSELESQRKG